MHSESSRKVLFIFLLGFIIFQSRGLFNDLNKKHRIVSKIGWLFLISSLANIGWILAWHNLRVFLSLIFMIILLLSLIGIYFKLNIGKNKFTGMEKVFINMPFSLYLGWITIATIANINGLMFTKASFLCIFTTMHTILFVPLSHF